VERGSSVNLTRAERLILHLWFAGRTRDAAVAELLGVCIQTITYHNRQIYAKLGARNKAHAAALAFQAGMVNL
jgi:DNA-binding NarL/FixJ family response regulator